MKFTVWLEDASLACDCGESGGVDIQPDDGYCGDDEGRVIQCDYCGRTWTLRLVMTPADTGEDEL